MVNDYPTGPVRSDERPRGRDYWSGMTAAQRDEVIVRMRRKGYTLRKIATALKMSTSGVSDALQRIAEGRSGADPRD